MNTKLRCLILDDELPGLAYLKMLCEQFPEVEVVKAFNDPKLFLEESSSLEFDACILDIEMGEINGLQIANILKDKAIIFVTAYKEYAAEAFDLNAVDYVRKPIQRDRLKQAIDKAIRRVEKAAEKKNFVQLNSEKGKILLYFDQISHITIAETDSRDKVVHLIDKKTLTLKNISFDKLLEVLPQDLFCRINKKEIIALKVIQYFSHDEIISTIFQGDTPVRFFITDTYRADFMKKTNH
ncbi:DNA-binding LytR/AlgR family response regulator [Dysgonomonas alginatilytica]|uniref:DNA-binding LytR/AlgR family response regulator n=1 Tax=Dysgonomonas alginatilytica TaxID=1605892 RepID=A0A2V3PVA8_9BACT|nr:response regulator [Dysgonomonas alginatilytica]PXV69062.1 DNA-binding LytR/AlgR family response regulator [Dysgonomonas alginatilytica]